MLKETEKIRLVLLMADSNSYEISLARDEPLLRDLFQMLLNRSEGRAGDRAIEIAIDEGRSRLHIPSKALVAILTDPPVEPNQIVRENQPVPTEKKAASTACDLYILSRYYQLEQFLPKNEYNMLLGYLGKQKAAYGSSDGGPTLAESFAELRNLLSNRVLEVLPEVLMQLGIPAFPLPEIETVLYPEPLLSDRVFRDNGSSETERRVLSFIYYFYRQPKAFAGGELILYDSQIENGVCIPAESFKSIVPSQNSIVFFLSSYAYQIQPLLSPASVPLADTCFKFQGWLRRH
ncbi:MAG: hypothetical protein F6J93_35300 [Oscillatoria sp. SIO1A7]|nr:hypothetical protein [Oscillatoria sp. SIO1A7]